MSVPSPPDHQNRFVEPAVERVVPDSFQRDFWVPYLRDCRGFDADELAERSDAWVWARTREVTA
ncbi:hypothetical protein HRTV-28_gp56 [Halorubrum tailed virus 28]|uniref:Uncharacterized protein n=1 Tax=Halorubrum tailed virus 28 TaxID=2878009 RepID=A0AAE8Y0W6_9CAUD|nr:hypothetical protein M1M39_gp57 [Halorubrum tailed virus 28]UBF23494.1 hypothetical protein HRTV-28_gp56 [Halorubrum tailed virus 28]